MLYQAGNNIQNSGAIAIGYQSGQASQGQQTVAIGYQAAFNKQNTGAIAIGYQAGYNNQGTNSIAIGYQAGDSQAQNSIILNASNSALSSATLGFYVAPIRNDTQSNVLSYDPGTNEITYYNKTFIIDHPTDNNKFLVHACLEGPEAGVYYRGKGVINDNISVDIALPDYVDKIATNLTVQITPIYDNTSLKTYNVSEVKDNKFTVYGVNGSFFWYVIGKRNEINVEPLKSKVQVKGTGPYKYI